MQERGFDGSNTSSAFSAFSASIGFAGARARWRKDTFNLVCERIAFYNVFVDLFKGVFLVFQGSTGFSKSHDPKVAAKEAVTLARSALGDLTPDFALLFATVGYEQRELLAAFSAQLGDVPIIGCSGVGVISGERGDESNFSVALALFSSDTVGFELGFASSVHENPEAAGSLLDRSIERVEREGGGEVLAVLLFVDGVHVNLDRVVSAIQSEKPIFGGAAGDNWKILKTYQYYRGAAHSGGMCWAIIHGEGLVDWSLSHGCIPVGGMKTVTKARGNELYEIDGQCVLDVLSEYLESSQINTWDSPIGNISLGFEAPKSFESGDDPYEYLITHVAPTEGDARMGRVVIPREIEEGTKVWIMRRSLDRIVQGNQTMAQSLKARHRDETPAFVLHVDCASRGRVCFGEKKKSDLLLKLQRDFAPTAPWIGFYSYGEFCPVSCLNCGHCYTAVLFALYL